MKALLLALFLVASMAASSQFGIGYTASQVYDKLVDKDETAKSYRLDNGATAIIISSPKKSWKTVYLIKKETQICEAYVLVPDDSKARNLIAKYCDDNFVQETTRSWRTYVRDFTITIKLEYVDGFGLCFFFRRADDD